jgi:hypothetical protein
MGRILLVGVVLVLCVVHARACSALPRDDRQRTREVRAQLASLRRALREEDAAARMQEAFATGGCFLPTLYALAWANVARGSDDPEVRATARDEIAFALDAIVAPAATRPFHDTQVERGVFWCGQRNLVLGELLSLTPAQRRAPALVDEFHARSAALAAAFDEEPIRHLDTYPGACWPADQLAALVSLGVHDSLFGTDHARAARAWSAWTMEHLDPSTRLPAGEIRVGSGRLVQPARGCGTSWILAMLPRIDPALSRALYERYVAGLGRQRLGFTTFGEWPHGVDGPSDADSGSILWEVGVAATGIGLAAARANGDAAAADDIYALAQTFGLPWTSRGGTEKSYLLRRLPMGDAFLAFGLSVPVPAVRGGAPRGPADRLRDRWPLHALVLAVQLGLVVSLVRSVRRRRSVDDAEAG